MPWTLVLGVHECKQLKDTAMMGSQSPYVELRLAQERFLSKTVKNGGVKPSFEQKFMFNLDQSDPVLHIEVKSQNALLDSLIGRADITLEALAATNGLTWHQIRDANGFAGYIGLTASFQGQSPSAPQAHAQPLPSAPQQQPLYIDPHKRMLPPQQQQQAQRVQQQQPPPSYQQTQQMAQQSAQQPVQQRQYVQQQQQPVQQQPRQTAYAQPQPQQQVVYQQQQQQPQVVYVQQPQPQVVHVQQPNVVYVPPAPVVYPYGYRRPIIAPIIAPRIGPRVVRRAVMGPRVVHRGIGHGVRHVHHGGGRMGGGHRHGGGGRR